MPTLRPRDTAAIRPGRLFAAAALALALAAAGCSAVPREVTRSPGGPPVFQIELSTSNAFLIRSAQPILVDAGSPGDLEDLTEQLAEAGVALADVKLAIVTHGHGDHAALGGDLKKAGVKVAVGAGDFPLAAAGRNDELQPTNLTARLIRPFIDFEYPPFAPDIRLTDRGLDLGPYGVKGKAFQLPGHTAGSVVVVLDDGSAFAGDMILGGLLGGAIAPGCAGEHYYHADREQNLLNIRLLLRAGVQTFYLGHGGPVTRESVIDGFDLDPESVSPRR